MHTSIDILGGSHNELLGIELVSAIEQAPSEPWLRARLAHPDAVAQGQRYLGTSEITGHYPGDPDGDPEDVAAHNNMQWLGPHAGSPNVLVYDIHNSDYPGIRYQAVGHKVLASTVVGAYLLGYPRCVLSAGALYDAVPNAAALETPVTDPMQYGTLAQKLLEGLPAVASHPPDELAAMYADIAPKLSFYKGYEIMTAPDGDMLPYIKELEQIDMSDGFTPVPVSDLPGALLADMNVPPDTELFSGPWGHRNMSPLQPDLGTTEMAGQDIGRRVCFGELFMRIESPVFDGQWLTFGRG